jgi:hypothetical protein
VLDNIRLCPVCGADWGPPNVRAARDPSERKALMARAAEASANARNRRCQAQLNAFVTAVSKNSHVVIALNPLVARQHLQDRKNLYANYETLVEGGTRLPAAAVHDLERTVVGRTLFGASASAIRYGALSLDGTGVASYGEVFFRLRDVAVIDRVSFLEENSYHFVRNSCRPGDALPKGYRSGWNDRHMLAQAKLEPSITENSKASDWPHLLLKSDGVNRDADRFIEAHIFDSFSIDAVEQVAFTLPKDRQMATDFKAIRHEIAKSYPSVIFK